MTDINAVIAFYRARLDEEEEAARASARGPWRVDARAHAPYYLESPGWTVAANLTRDDAVHMARHDPARALKKVAAGRKLIHLHWQSCEQVEMLAGHGIDATGSKVAAESYANTILVNAAVWDDHQDWDASWRPGWMDEIGYLPHQEASEQ